MIVYRAWKERYNGGHLVRHCDGWFLFGILPLYVRKVEM